MHCGCVAFRFAASKGGQSRRSGQCSGTNSRRRSRNRARQSDPHTGSYRLAPAIRTSTVAIMTRRASSPYFASLLVVLQLLLAPFAHAEVMPSDDVDCAGMLQGGAMSMDAGDCAHMTIDTDGDCQQDGQRCHGHAACSCPCAHTPALETVRVLLLEPTPPVAVEYVLVTPAFDTPLFKLLRPPK